MSKTHIVHRFLSPVLFGALLLTASGCSVFSGGKQYDFPREFCGVAMSKAALDPLLPEGEKLHPRQGELSADFTDCQIIIDGARVLNVTVYDERGPYDPVEEGGTHPFTELAPIDMEGNAAVANEGAAINVECDIHEASYLNVEIVVDERVTADAAQRRKDIVRFVKDFVPEMKKELRCVK